MINLKWQNGSLNGGQREYLIGRWLNYEAISENEKNDSTMVETEGVFYYYTTRAKWVSGI